MTKDRHALEKSVIEEIKGIGYSGMESGYAFTSFRQNYYENIQDEMEKAEVREILMDLLARGYNSDIRCKAAWICADIDVPGTEEKLVSMLKEPDVAICVKDIEYALKRFRLENNIKAVLDSVELFNKHDSGTVLSSVRKKLIDYLADPIEKAAVINVLAKFINSNQYDRSFRIKAAWLCAELGAYSIKEEIEKMLGEPSWREEPYRRYLDELMEFIDEKITYVSRGSDSFSKKVEYQLAFDEYLEAQCAYVKTSRFGYYGFWSLGILGITVGTVGIILLPGMKAGYGAFLLGAYFVLSVTLFHRYRVGRIWEKEPSIRDPLVAEITEADLYVISPHEDGRAKWSAFSRFLETERLFLLFRQRSTFNVIPKRVFRDASEIAIFRHLLERKISAPK